MSSAKCRSFFSRSQCVQSEPLSWRQTHLSLNISPAAVCAKDHQQINSSAPSAAYMRQWIGSALVHIMACRLFGAKPLSKPMPFFVNWTFRIKPQWNFNKKVFHSRKCVLKCRLLKWKPFCTKGRWVNRTSDVFCQIRIKKLWIQIHFHYAMFLFLCAI